MTDEEALRGLIERLRVAARAAADLVQECRVLGQFETAETGTESGAPPGAGAVACGLVRGGPGDADRRLAHLEPGSSEDLRGGTLSLSASAYSALIVLLGLAVAASYLRYRFPRGK
jgi:hypothetical protein